VEASFRLSKHDLRARPVFHHQRAAIEAHLTVVMASMAVARLHPGRHWDQHPRIVRELRSLQEVTINLNGHQITAQPHLTQTATSILKSLKSPGH
jgi:putative transposase